MSIIKPFRALRPRVDIADKVSCVPYDVPYESEVREHIAENPLSFLRVTRPEAEFPEGSKPGDEQIIAKAKANLEAFVNDRILVADAEPSLYIYRLSVGPHTQTGIVACCSIDEYDRGLIKKHEKTRPDKVKDRTNHMTALRAQTGLIFLAFRDTEATRHLIAAETGRTPLYECPCDAVGVTQTVWRVEKTDAMVKAFSEVPALYVADGHHRAESASLARKMLCDQNPNHDGSEDYNFVMAGIFPANDLKILPYNRVVKDLNGLSEARFLEMLSENFRIAETSDEKPAQHREICMYLGGLWYKLTFAVDFIREPDPIERLDVSILQQYILAPILGIADPRTDVRIDFVGGGRGTEELRRRVDRGSAAVAFSLYPTTIDDLFAVSDMGEIMPPKSTWFEPKLKDGLFVHLI